MSKPGPLTHDIGGVNDLSPACLIGLVGRGIQKTRSAGMQTRECTLLGVRFIYRLIDSEKLGLGQADLPRLVEAAQWLGYNGLAVTYPFKQTIIPLLDELSPDAEAIGAVNTVIFRDGRKIGHNTDWFGYFSGFDQSFPNVARDCVVQLGAGGAGAAVAYAAMKLGVKELCLFDIDGAKARDLANTLNARFGADRARAVTDLAAAMAKADGLIHCTPTGMAAMPGMALPRKLLNPRLWVSDIVYYPLETELLRTAGALGCRVSGGENMVIGQAVEQIRLFTGLNADLERLRAHFRSWT